MKKLVAAILSVLMIAALTACSDNTDNNGGYDDYRQDETVKTYEKIGDDTFHFESVDSVSVRITNFESTDDAPHAVTIPAYLDGKQVVGIAEEAFRYKSNISTVIFPTAEDYQEGDADFSAAEFSFTIAKYAFRDCAVLSTVTLPDYVTEIGTGIFYGCAKLESVTFADNCRIASIPSYSFMECPALKTIVLPASVLSVGEAAFFECASLESVTVEEAAEGSTQLILAKAFMNCKNLSSVTLPASVISVGKYAFHGSEKLYTDGFHYAGTSEEVQEYIKGLMLTDSPAESETETTGN